MLPDGYVTEEHLACIKNIFFANATIIVLMCLMPFSLTLNSIPEGDFNVYRTLQICKDGFGHTGNIWKCILCLAVVVKLSSIFVWITFSVEMILCVSW